MTLDATPIPNHFWCYKAKGDSVDVTVSLQDQFGGKPGFGRRAGVVLQSG